MEAIRVAEEGSGQCFAHPLGVRLHDNCDVRAAHLLQFGAPISGELVEGSIHGMNVAIHLCALGVSALVNTSGLIDKGMDGRTFKMG